MQIRPKSLQMPPRIHKGGHPLQNCPKSGFAKHGLPCVCVVALAVVGAFFCVSSKAAHSFLAGDRLEVTITVDWEINSNIVGGGICLLVGCLTSQQHASVSQGRICLDNVTCCHTEIEVADQTFHLTQSQYTDTGPTSPSTDPITPGAWQGSHWSANV